MSQNEKLMALGITTQKSTVDAWMKIKGNQSIVIFFVHDLCVKRTQIS